MHMYGVCFVQHIVCIGYMYMLVCTYRKYHCVFTVFDTYLYVYTYKHICAYACIHVYAHACVGMYVCVLVYTCVYVLCMYECMYVCMCQHTRRLGLVVHFPLGYVANINTA